LYTDNAIYALLNDVLTALNNKSKVKGIFCDTEKAFDCVNHDILLHKLETTAKKKAEETLASRPN
jgi:2-phospho-L-lactate guanylyltransferase (CobY/MobA/RfbA family)